MGATQISLGASGGLGEVRATWLASAKAKLMSKPSAGGERDLLGGLPGL
jgi:hypothetical protein